MAAEAKNGDRVSVRALADETLDARFMGFGELPEKEVEALKIRIVNAEMDYRSGKGNQKPIDERDVARMINYLGDTLGLPDYARTSSVQVRNFRIGLWQYVPEFVGQANASERANPKAKLGTKVTSRMSPLEAAYVATTLMEQKANNPAYQVSPKDERRYVYELKLRMWEDHRNGKTSQNQSTSQLGNRRETYKAAEIREAVSKGLASMTQAELEGLPNNALDALGIPR